MLYIKFNITQRTKFTDFKRVYDYMITYRKQGYSPKDEIIEIDFATATEEEISNFWDEDKPKRKLFDKIFPDYASSFILGYNAIENQKSIFNNESKVSFIDYLQDGFEVDLNDLKITDNNLGIVKFSTGNYPFGGLDRFFMILKAFELTPTECFNGFDVVKIIWKSDYEYEAQVLTKKTEEYLKS